MQEVQYMLIVSHLLLVWYLVAELCLGGKPADV